MEITDKMNSLGLKAVELATSTGSISRGTNEATKMIERGKAALVVVAGNVDPPEVVMHLGPLCEEKGIPYVYVRDKEELGRASGVQVKCASIAITNPGEAKSVIEDITKETSSEKVEVEEAPAEEAASEEASAEEEAPIEEPAEAPGDETPVEAETELAEDEAKEEESEEAAEEAEAEEKE